MSQQANQSLLAFDFGLKRVGVASGNRLTGTATPVGIDEARRIAASQLALFFPRHFSRSGPR